MGDKERGEGKKRGWGSDGEAVDLEGVTEETHNSRCLQVHTAQSSLSRGSHRGAES